MTTVKLFEDRAFLDKEGSSLAAVSVYAKSEESDVFPRGYFWASLGISNECGQSIDMDLTVVDKESLSRAKTRINRLQWALDVLLRELGFHQDHFGIERLDR